MTRGVVRVEQLIVPTWRLVDAYACVSDAGPARATRALVDGLARRLGPLIRYSSVSECLTSSDDKAERREAKTISLQQLLATPTITVWPFSTHPARRSRSVISNGRVKERLRVRAAKNGRSMERRCVRSLSETLGIEAPSR